MVWGSIVLHALSWVAARLSAETGLSSASLWVSENTLLGANNGCQPQRIHLALTSDPTEMRLSWTTVAHNCKGNVFFGRRKDDALDFVDSAIDSLDMIVDHKDSGSYTADDLCGKPAVNDDFDPPHLHTAVMSGLVPGKYYSYRIDHHTKIRHFKAAPPVSADSSFMFIAYSDMGDYQHKKAKSPGAKMTADRVSKEVQDGAASLVLHLGDISYADGKHNIWESFLDQIEPYASAAPYQVVVGNHEYDWKTGKEKKHAHPTDASGKEEMYDPAWGNFGNDSGGECGVIFSKLFTMPGSQLVETEGDRYQAANHRSDVPNPPFWFSYSYGSVHFATLSSEHDLSHGSHQRKWLKQDLGSVDRCVTPWLVVLIHRPMYVVHPHKSNRIVGEHLRQSLEELLEEFEVDAVMSGHIHAYARTCNIYNSKCIKNKKGGTTHLTLGNGGRKLSDVKHEQPEWLEYADREFGYVRVTVSGGKAFFIEYVSSKTGKIRDSVLLEVAPSATQRCQLAKTV